MSVVCATGSPRCRTHPVAWVLVFVIATLGSASVPTFAHAASATARLSSQERSMCRQINRYRATKGLRALKVSVNLTRAARWMSLSMAADDYLNHSDRLGRGTSTRIRSFGYRNRTLGENIAGGAASAKTTFEQWRRDAPHRAVMLGANFKVIGIGRAHNADSTLGWYWTTTFGGANDRAVAC